MIRPLMAAAIALAALSANAAPSFAGGWFADTFVRPISPHLADEADKVHKQMGNPLDHAANGVAGGAVAVATGNPTAGVAVTTALEARDDARRAGN